MKDLYIEGRRIASLLSIKERMRLLIGLRKDCKDVSDVFNLVEKEIKKKKESGVVFRSVVDRCEFVIGFLSYVSYITKEDIQKEINKLAKELNLLDIPQLCSHYITFLTYRDKRYAVVKERIKITVRPKEGFLGKTTSRVPKINDVNEVKRKVDELRDLCDLYVKAEERKLLFWKKMM